MKTQQQAQAIYDVIIYELQGTNATYLYFLASRIYDLDTEQETPLQSYLKSIQKNLEPGDFNEEFLSRIYAEAFHIGEIPKNRNHIAITCALTIGKQSTSPVLKYWIDLDKVAALTNAHFHITPPVRFQVKGDSSNLTSSLSSWIMDTSSAVNSVYDPNTLYTNFLIGSMCSGVLSGVALVIAILAIASLVPLSTAGIYTAVGIGVFAAALSYSLFKATDLRVNTNPIFIESEPVNIVAIFQQHFAQTIQGPNVIDPGEGVEITEVSNALTL